MDMVAAAFRTNIWGGRIVIQVGLPIAILPSLVEPRSVGLTEACKHARATPTKGRR